MRSAKRAVVAGHCAVGSVERLFSQQVKKGHVISAMPGAGKTLAQGAKVALTVSMGERPKK